MNFRVKCHLISKIHLPLEDIWEKEKHDDWSPRQLQKLGSHPSNGIYVISHPPPVASTSVSSHPPLVASVLLSYHPSLLPSILPSYQCSSSASTSVSLDILSYHNGSQPNWCYLGLVPVSFWEGHMGFVLSHVLGKDSAKGSEHGIQSMGQRRLHHLRLHTLCNTFQFSPPLTWLKLKVSWIWVKNDGEMALFLLSWSAKLHARFLSSHNVNSVFLPTSLLFYSTLPFFSHSFTFIYWALSFEVPNRGRTKQ